MKEVILKALDDVTVQDALDQFYHNPEVIIAYETAQSNGLGIFTERKDACQETVYGFCYHKHLIHKQCSMKYQARTAPDALIKVIHDGRRLIMFESFEEFVEHAASMNVITY